MVGHSSVFLFLIKETLLKIHLLFFGYKHFNSFVQSEGLSPRTVLCNECDLFDGKDKDVGRTLELHGVRFPASHHKTHQRNIFVSHSHSPWTPKFTVLVTP